MTLCLKSEGLMGGQGPLHVLNPNLNLSVIHTFILTFISVSTTRFYLNKTRFWFPTRGSHLTK